MKIGVLAVQGAFAEHLAALKKLGAKAVEARLPQELDGLDGLIIPGGESTTITKLMAHYRLADKLKSLAGRGFPIWGTCAGMIVMANEIPDSSITPLGIMDITVRRNAFGRQKESFEADLAISELGDKPFPSIFIRAPLIEKTGQNVKILAQLGDGTIVAAQEGNLLATSFHPELTADTRFHEYFIKVARQDKIKRTEGQIIGKK